MFLTKCCSYQMNIKEVKKMAPTEMPMWVSILGNFGFPITIAVYLLIRFEKKIERLTGLIQDMQKGVRK